MAISDLYIAFSFAAAISTALCVYLIRSNPSLSYLVSLTAMLILTHLIVASRFNAVDRGPFYPGVFVLNGVIASMVLLVLHIAVRIAIDLAGPKKT